MATTRDHQSARVNVDTTAAPLLNPKKAMITPDCWPTSPKRVQSSAWMTLWNGVFDLLLFTCAVAFLAFAAIVSQYDQASTAENHRTTVMLVNATKYGPTVFPILFALILGRATHTILRWRLERGERIGVLNTLAASTSLTSTAISQFQMRAISVFGIVLLSVWALSPVGGQASIRQMTLGIKNATQPAEFGYLTHNGYFTGFLTNDRDSVWELVNTLFVSAIIGSIASKSAALDTWGNIRIPRIEYYEANTTTDADGWFDTVGGSHDSYSSMVGIPLSGTNSTTFVNYNTNIGRFMDPVVPEGMVNFTGPGAVIMFNNATQRRRAYSNPKDLDTFQFRYITRLWRKNNHQLDCSLSTSYIETEIYCSDSTSCLATKVRRSRLQALPAAWTLLDLYWANPIYLFSQVLTSVRGRSGWPTLLDRYLSDPESVVILKENDTMGSVPISTEAHYSVRMSQFLNSYFTVMNGLYTIAGGLNIDTADFANTSASFVRPVNQRNDTRHKPDEILWHSFLPAGDSSNRMKGKAWSATGTKSTSTEVIIAHKPWVITLCIVSIVLILASLVSPLVHIFLIRGPEVLMNISSLATRHDAYMPLPEGGTHLGASARAWLLKRLKVRLGDLEEGSEVGHLVIGALKGADGYELAGIKKGRLYE